MRKTLIAVALMAMLAAACAGPAATSPPQTPPPEAAAAVAAALAQLAEALGLPAGQIAVVSVEAVEWPDSCLGIAYPNARCAQALTPGYRIVLEASGRRYQVHTNHDGSSVALAVPSLTWHREGGIAGFCDDLFVSGFGEAQASECGRDEVAGELTEAELVQLNDWAAQYGSVVIEIRNPDVSDDMPVMLVLNGMGAGQPDEAEQQAILAWAQTVYDRLKS